MIVISHLFHSLKVVCLFLAFRPYFTVNFTGEFPHNLYGRIHTLTPTHVSPRNLYGRIPTHLLPARISTQPLRADSHTLIFRPHFHTTFTGEFPHTYFPPVFHTTFTGGFTHTYSHARILYATFTGGFPHTYSPPVFPHNLYGQIHTHLLPRTYLYATFTGGFTHTYLPPAFPRNLYGRISTHLLPARIPTQYKGSLSTSDISLFS